MLLDIVFSLDSVITAIGMANELWVMATAIIIAMAIMLGAAAPLSAFVDRHPTVKVLALSFLLLIGMTLVADGVGLHVPKGYIYAAIGSSVAVEVLNQIGARRRKPRRRSPDPTDTYFRTSCSTDCRTWKRSAVVAFGSAWLWLRAARKAGPADFVRSG